MTHHETHISDGYTAIPPGKIAAIATSLQMTARPPARPAPAIRSAAIRRVETPDVDWYLDLYRRIGEPWLWQSRLRLQTEALAAIITDPAVEIWSVDHDGRAEGLLELDFRQAGECELAFFGLTTRLVGAGLGRALMNHAIERAWSRSIRRFWVHTCTLDHPAALAFYQRSGFVPYRLQVEVADDPRLDGTYPASAAPQVPIIAIP